MSIVHIFATSTGGKQAWDEHRLTYYPSTGITRNSASILVGEQLPQHDHTTNLLKKKAKEEEIRVIQKHATLPGTSNKAMVNEIAHNILSSSLPNALYSMSTTSALKLALHREKKLNPLPPLPKTYQDVMKPVIPASLSNTANGWEFFVLNSWINDLELEAMMVFMSETGADVMRRAPVWMMYGTFYIAPKPSYQVTMVKS
jgi:hypothetical protein